MIANRCLWILAAGAMLGALPAAAQDVRAGIEAWEAERYDEAVRNWRPLADRGDADAQFNLGHAYRLGRGVPRNMTLAEQWYERAARQGRGLIPNVSTKELVSSTDHFGRRAFAGKSSLATGTICGVRSRRTASRASGAARS